MRFAIGCRKIPADSAKTSRAEQSLNCAVLSKDREEGRKIDCSAAYLSAHLYAPVSSPVKDGGAEG